MSSSPTYNKKINEYWILVTGGLSVGKTEFIRSISEYDEWDMSDYPKELGKHLAWHGRIDLDEHTTVCFYQPPSARLLPTMQDIEDNRRVVNWIGIIFIASNYVHKNYSRFFLGTNAVIKGALEMLPIPYVVTANQRAKIPYLPSLNEEYQLLTFKQVVEQLDVAENIPTLQCNVKDKISVQRVILALMEEIIRSLS